MLAVQFHMKRLENLCINYLESSINHRNVLIALKNADQLRLFVIKEFCLRFIIKDVTYNQIIMSKEFENLQGVPKKSVICGKLSLRATELS